MPSLHSEGSLQGTWAPPSYRRSVVSPAFLVNVEFVTSGVAILTFSSLIYICETEFSEDVPITWRNKTLYVANNNTWTFVECFWSVPYQALDKHNFIDREITSSLS